MALRQRSAPLLPVIVGLLLVAAGPTRQPAAETLEGRPASETDSLDQALAGRLVDELLPEVEELRGLSFKRAVPVSVIDDEAVRRHMMHRLESFLTADDIAAWELAYVTLGLLPPDIDIVDAYLEVLQEQAGGFYDPETASLFLVGRMPAALAAAITAHELTHALEDQHYDLDRRLREAVHNDDRLFALGALHEGSANLLMSVLLVQRAIGDLSDPEELMSLDVGDPRGQRALDRLPAVLLRQLVGPYVLGTEFLSGGDLTAVAAGYPSRRVDRAFADAPLSSEQILHPDKYWDEQSRDDPRPVELGGAGDLLGAGWVKKREGVLGELSLGVMVGAETPLHDGQWSRDSGESWTNPAAAGWGGDLWELWVRKGSAVVLLGTVWDSARDAAEFVGALPRREGLYWNVEGDRAAVVAGDLGRKKAGRLLDRMLVDGARGAPREPGGSVPPLLVPPGGNR